MTGTVSLWCRGYYWILLYCKKKKKRREERHDAAVHVSFFLSSPLHKILSTQDPPYPSSYVSNEETRAFPLQIAITRRQACAETDQAKRSAFAFSPGAIFASDCSPVSAGWKTGCCGSLDMLLFFSFFPVSVSLNGVRLSWVTGHLRTVSVHHDIALHSSLAV